MTLFTVFLMVVLICSLLFVGYLLISGKPIRIEHIHREIIEQEKIDPKVAEEFENQQQSINNFIAKLNKEMGVLSDEQIEQPEKE